MQPRRRSWAARFAAALLMTAALIGGTTVTEASAAPLPQPFASCPAVPTADHPCKDTTQRKTAHKPNIAQQTANAQVPQAECPKAHWYSADSWASNWACSASNGALQWYSNFGTALTEMFPFDASSPDFRVIYAWNEALALVVLISLYIWNLANAKIRGARPSESALIRTGDFITASIAMQFVPLLITWVEVRVMRPITEVLIGLQAAKAHDFLQAFSTVIMSGQVIGGAIFVLFFCIGIMVAAFALALVLTLRTIGLYVYTISFAYALAGSQSPDRWHSVKRPFSQGVALLLLEPAIALIILLGWTLGGNISTQPSTVQSIGLLSMTAATFLAALFAWPALTGFIAIGGETLHASHAAKDSIQNRNRLIPSARSVGQAAAINRAAAAFGSRSHGNGTGGATPPTNGTGPPPNNPPGGSGSTGTSGATAATGSKVTGSTSGGAAAAGPVGVGVAAGTAAAKAGTNTARTATTTASSPGPTRPTPPDSGPPTPPRRPPAPRNN